jgi:hypothetical protein
MLMDTRIRKKYLPEHWRKRISQLLELGYTHPAALGSVVRVRSLLSCAAQDSQRQHYAWDQLWPQPAAHL